MKCPRCGFDCLLQLVPVPVPPPSPPPQPLRLRYAPEFIRRCVQVIKASKKHVFFRDHGTLLHVQAAKSLRGRIQVFTGNLWLLVPDVEDIVFRDGSPVLADVSVPMPFDSEKTS